MSQLSWEQYVARLCLDAWSLDPAVLIKVMSDIESLVASGQVTDLSVTTVLLMAGVPRSEAESVAPRICAAIGATDTGFHAPPP